MTTDKQSAANRLNAQKSTGPTTPEGKAVSSRNALRHGLYARTAVFPNENQGEFDHMCADLVAEWQPQTATEHYQVEQMAVAYWIQKRLGRIRLAIFQECHDPIRRLTLFDQVDRQMARQTRAHSSALKDLRSLQADRRQRQSQQEKQQEQRHDQSVELPDTRPSETNVPPVVIAPNGHYHDPSSELHCLPNET